MIKILDNNPDNLVIISQYFNRHYPHMTLEISENIHFFEIESPGKNDIVIVNEDLLENVPNGWLHLIAICQSVRLLTIITHAEHAIKLKTFLTKSVAILESPITPQKLGKIFPTPEGMAAQSLSRQIEKKHIKEAQTKEEERQNLSKLQDLLFNNLLENHCFPQDIDNTMHFLGLASDTNQYYLAFVISFNPPSGHNAKKDEIWKKTLSVQSIVQYEIHKIAPMRSYVRDAGMLSCLLLMKEPEGLFRYELEKALEVIEKRAFKEYNVKISAGVGLACDAITDIGNSYRQACDALNQGNFFGNSFVCFFCDLHEKDFQRFQLSPKVKEKITQCLYQNNFTEIDKLLGEEFNNIIQLGLATKENVIALKVDLIIFLMDLSNKLSVISERPDIYSRLLNDILSAESLPLLESNIKKNLRNLLVTSRHILKKKTGKLISNVQKIILEELHEPVNVQMIAQKLCISPNYLSAIFKAETGTRLSEYITNIKMYEAARLLKSSNKNILEISSLTGYDNANYFSRLFKKQYGTTPSEYRRNYNL